VPISDVAFRKKLQAVRKTAKLTQVQLAQRLGKPQSFVSKYENGERRLDVLELIEVLRALKIDVVKFVKELIY